MWGISVPKIDKRRNSAPLEIGSEDMQLKLSNLVQIEEAEVRRTHFIHDHVLYISLLDIEQYPSS